MPSDIEEMALTMNGRKRKISKRDFMQLADNMGLNIKVAERLIDKLIRQMDVFSKMTEESYMTESMKKDMLELMKDRARRLEDIC